MPSLRTEGGRKNIAGVRIRELRGKLGLTQEELAAQLQLLGMDGERGVVKRMENGTRYINDLELKVLIAFFGAHFEYVTYEYLMEG